MVTEAHVAALRNMLNDYGLLSPRPLSDLYVDGKSIRSVNRRQESKCYLLQKGEWLISLLSHDRPLMDHAMLRRDIERIPDDLRVLRNEWTVDEFDDLSRGRVDVYVNLVKFHYMIYGVTETLKFISGFSFDMVRMGDLDSHNLALDRMVTMAERRLRMAGVKHRTMSAFFAL